MGRAHSQQKGHGAPIDAGRKRITRDTACPSYHATQHKCYRCMARSFSLAWLMRPSSTGVSIPL